MGEDVESRNFTRQDRQQYRAKVRRCLDVFARMLAEAKFDFERPLTGLEIELNLIDAEQDPAMRNAEVLAVIANEDFQTELGQFNIEINVRPRSLIGTAATELEAELRASLNAAEERSRAIGAHIVMIGMLPTLTPEHLTGESLSANPRYKLINEQIFAARGEDLYIAIEGVERLSTYADTIAPEAACTSVQFHLQVSPQDYAANWNAAQCLAGVQLALGANSPFLFGKELWRETRVALFEQATDTRPEELKAQGVRPRVWFGDRWITSIFDQFEENVRYFPALLPVCDDEDPAEVLARGDTPRLAELRMHSTWSCSQSAPMPKAWSEPSSAGGATTSASPHTSLRPTCREPADGARRSRSTASVRSSASSASDWRHSPLGHPDARRPFPRART